MLLCFCPCKGGNRLSKLSGIIGNRTLDYFLVRTISYRTPYQSSIYPYQLFFLFCDRQSNCTAALENVKGSVNAWTAQGLNYQIPYAKCPAAQ